MDERLLAVLVVAAGVIASQIAYLITVTFGAVILRVPISVISLGVGPELFGVRVGGVRMRAGAFVFSTYVKFKGGDELGEPSALELAPWWQKIFLALLGPAGMIGAAAIMLGADAWDHALSAFAFVGDLIMHSGRPIEFTGAVNAIIAESGVLGAMAQVVAFNGGLQLLPLSFMAGGGSLLYLSEAFHGGPLPTALTDLLHRVSFAAAVCVLLLAAYGIAL